MHYWSQRPGAHTECLGGRVAASPNIERSPTSPGRRPFAFSGKIFRNILALCIVASDSIDMSNSTRTPQDDRLEMVSLATLDSIKKAIADIEAAMDVTYSESDAYTALNNARVELIQAFGNARYARATFTEKNHD